jgi:hypothetical protein
MSRSLYAILGAVIVGLGFSAFALAGPAEQPAKPKLRVGTFDSRAIALAYFGKMVQDGWLEKLYARHAEAKEAGNKKLAAELEAKGQEQQKRLHGQVFGAAPVDDALERIEREIPKLAASAGVDVIVCIHDVVFRTPSAQFVDVTGPMVQLFEPDQETLEKIEAVLKHAPATEKVIESMERHESTTHGRPRNEE